MRNALYKLRLIGDLGLTLFGFMLCFVVGLVTLIAILTYGVRAISIHYDRAECNTYQRETGRDTRFVTYTYWSWDCLTRSNDGKWISTSQLREFPSK